MEPTLNQNDAHIFLNFLIGSALATFEELGLSHEVKAKFIENFRKRIRLQEEAVRNGD
jgi:hypothetical protein